MRILQRPSANKSKLGSAARGSQEASGDQKLQDKYAASVSISDREVEEYFTANRQEYIIPRGVELADIVVDPRGQCGLRDDAKTEAEAKTKIDAIYETLKTGDFAKIARQRART